MTDLQLLYRAKSTLEGYWGDEHYNQNCNQKAIEIKNAAKKDIAAKCKTTFTAVRKRSDKIVFADGGWIILFFLAAIVALVIAAPFTFAKPIMNFSLED